MEDQARRRRYASEQFQYIKRYFHRTTDISIWLKLSIVQQKMQIFFSSVYSNLKSMTPLKIGFSRSGPDAAFRKLDLLTSLQHQWSPQVKHITDFL